MKFSASHFSMQRTVSVQARTRLGEFGAFGPENFSGVYPSS
jgi:hypothetical protein